MTPSACLPDTPPTKPLGYPHHVATRDILFLRNDPFCSLGHRLRRFSAPEARRILAGGANHRSTSNHRSAPAGAAQRPTRVILFLRNDPFYSLGYRLRRFSAPEARRILAGGANHRSTPNHRSAPAGAAQRPSLSANNSETAIARRRRASRTSEIRHHHCPGPGHELRRPCRGAIRNGNFRWLAPTG